MKISVIIEINNLDPDIRNAPSVLKKNILKFIRPAASGILRYHNLNGVKYYTRLRVRVSHFYGHKNKNNFPDTFNLFCTCGFDIDVRSSLIHFTNFLTEINIRLKKVTIIDGNTLNPADAN